MHLNFRRFEGDFLRDSIERLRAECVLREVADLSEDFDIKVMDRETDPSQRQSQELCPDCEAEMWATHIHGTPEVISILLDNCEDLSLNLEGVLGVPDEEMIGEFQGRWNNIDVVVYKLVDNEEDFDPGDLPDFPGGDVIEEMINSD